MKGIHFCYMLSHKRTIGSNPSDALTIPLAPAFGHLARAISVSDHLGEATQSACCGGCQNSAESRPRLVVGVFNDAQNANGVAERLRGRAPGSVNVLSSHVPMLAQDLDGLPTLALMGCGRLYQQITAQLDSGASIIVVAAHSPEQQLGISRVLLEAKCDLLLTHDGSGHSHEQ